MRRFCKCNRRNVAAAWMCALGLLPTACAGPGPTLFPVAAIVTRSLPDGGVERDYDTDGDGRADYTEQLSPAGRIVRLRYGLSDGQSADEETIVLDKIAVSDCRRLLIILDSIPYDMVRDLWEQGRFRLFAPPSRVISPFPVMTDLSLAEFFDVSPCPGVESEYFDGAKLTQGYSSYAGGRNTPWKQFVDYDLDPAVHSVAYLHPAAWFDHELRQIEELVTDRTRRSITGYCVGTSGLGARIGRNGHQIGLIKLDRFCQSIMHASRGRIQITLMSDHGHNLMSSRRIPLSDLLRRCGYRVRNRLERPGDVVVPEFGIVTYAGVHTREAAAVARDAVGLEGIDIAAFRDDTDRVIVLSRRGRASISRRENAFRYDAQVGDPLGLEPIITRIRSEGLVDAEGFVDDRALFDATVDHTYPDTVQRLWRAFHGLIEHAPDVLLSVRDGWHCGSPFMTDMLDLAAAHGNLNPPSSMGFVMTTAGKLPPVVRMEDLRAALSKAGVSTSSNEATTQPNH